MRRACLILFLTLHPALLPAPVHAQDTVTLTYHGLTRDLVAPDRVLTPDGTPDPTFRVCISGNAKHIGSVRLTSSAGGAWSTNPGNWILGVTLEATTALINAANTGAVDFAGTCFYISGAQGGSTRWPAGATATVTVVTVDAPQQTYTGTLAIPATPTPLPAPTQPPPPDTDNDGVPNLGDRCPATPTGTAVDPAGTTFAGCPTGDTIGPAITLRYPVPKASEPVRGMFAISATAKDPSAVAAMVVSLVSWPGITDVEQKAYPQGVPIAIDTTTPDGNVFVPVESRGWATGQYVIRVDAVDWRGNLTMGTPATFTVDNAPVSGGGVGTAGPQGPAGPTGPEGPTAPGSLVILPASAPVPAGYVKVADLGALGVLYAKQ